MVIFTRLRAWLIAPLTPRSPRSSLTTTKREFDAKHVRHARQIDPAACPEGLDMYYSCREPASARSPEISTRGTDAPTPPPAHVDAEEAPATTLPASHPNQRRPVQRSRPRHPANSAGYATIAVFAGERAGTGWARTGVRKAWR